MGRSRIQPTTTQKGICGKEGQRFFYLERSSYANCLQVGSVVLLYPEHGYLGRGADGDAEGNVLRKKTVRFEVLLGGNNRGKMTVTSLSFMANMMALACSAALPTMGRRMTLIKGTGIFHATEAPCRSSISQLLSSEWEMELNKPEWHPRGTRKGRKYRQ